MNVVQIPVKQVFPDPKQPRKTFKAETLRELGETIKKRGQRQPINVEPADGGYMIVEGERRWRACILAGIPTVDAIVRERSNHNGRENLLSQIIENVQREDMNPVDEALAYRELQTKHGMVVNEIAHEVGKNSSRVYKLLKILDLPVKVQELIRDDRLSHDERLVDALLSITDRKAQTGLAERAANKKMKIAAVVDAADRMNAAMGARPVLISKDRSPALTLARRNLGSAHSPADDEKEPPRWNALKQVGKLPPWPLVLSNVKETCQRCELRDMANESTCGNCPLVNMLFGMMEEAWPR